MVCNRKHFVRRRYKQAVHRELVIKNDGDVSRLR